jgi:hypothetical protein
MKVVCIKPNGYLTLNAVYTVIGDTGHGGFYLAELEAPEGYTGFWKWRFRPIEEKGDVFIEEFITIDEEEKKCITLE